MSSVFSMVDWIKSSNIYEVNVRQYTTEGTFKAFAREMPRLRDMGIDILWFMPITPISKAKRLGTLGSYYACSDYMAINPEFGDMNDFKQVVREAHLLGMKVIIDIVANHTGWDHRWTVEHPEYYRVNGEGQFFDPHGWADVIDLNYDKPELRAAMIDVLRFWLKECDMDGFRCDMAMLVPLEFWREAREKLDAEKALFWLAECEEISYHEVFDVTYTWKLLHKMEAVWRRESGVGGLDEVLQYYDTMFPRAAVRTFFTTNHDENSHSGSEYERMGDAAKAFAVLCCTWSGLPMIYSGQELPNFKRLKFFDKDFIEWSGRYDLHGFYQAMLSLRKRCPALWMSEATLPHRLPTGDDRCFAFMRRSGDAEVRVLLNISADQVQLSVKEWGMSGVYGEVFSGNRMEFPRAETVPLGPWSYMILEKKAVL